MFKPGSGRKKQNPAWNYFKYDAQKGASICQVAGCFAEIRGKNATNIKNHLRRKHVEVSENMGLTLDETFSKDSSLNSEYQQTMDEIVLKNIKREWDHDSRVESDKDVRFVKFLITSGLPATVVDNQELRDFLSITGASYELPGKDKTDCVIDYIVEKAAETMKMDIGVANSIVLSMRCWSSDSTESVNMSVSASFFSRSTKACINILLNVFSIHEPYSALSLESKLQQCLENWEIDPKKIAMVMTESSPKTILMKTGNERTEADRLGGLIGRKDLQILEREGIRWLPCLTQYLHLAVRDILNMPCARDLLEGVRAVVRSVIKSSIFNEELTRAGEQEIMLDSPIIAGSTYSMIARLLELRTPLDHALTTLNEQRIQWEGVEEMKNVLEPFRESIETLETQESSLSMIIPTLMEVFVKLRKMPQTELTGGSVESLKRWSSPFLDSGHPDFNPIPGASSLLDPTVSQFMHRQEVQEVLEASIKYIKATVSKPTKEGEIVKDQTKKPAKMFKVLHEDTPSMIVSSYLTENGVEQELKSYMKAALVYEGEDGSYFWTEHGINYPLLAPLAEDLLAVPTSQAHVERCFAQCANLVQGVEQQQLLQHQQLQQHQQPENLERRTFLKINYKHYLE